jgi:predicted translin family RNA/ssDNA-binding protein
MHQPFLPATEAKRLVTRQSKQEAARRELSLVSQRLQGLSKRAIFAMHRDDQVEAGKLLKEGLKLVSLGQKQLVAVPVIAQDGAWRASREEFLEARLLASYLQGTSIAFLNQEDPEIAIGALSDLVGELVRQAVMEAVKGNRESVEKMLSVGQQVVATLLEMDLTGSLRSKVDQAKGHLRKLEDIRYDLAMRIRLSSNE